MNWKLIRVAAVLGNLLIVVVDGISDDFRSTLCNTYLTPDQVYKLLKEHNNQRELIGEFTVGDLLLMEMMGLNYCDFIELRMLACGLLADDMRDCNSIVNYCFDRLKKLKNICRLRANALKRKPDTILDGFRKLLRYG